MWISVKHPGGDEILIEEGARDATGPFEDVGHSPDAREMLEKYYVGDVDPTVSKEKERGLRIGILMCVCIVKTCQGGSTCCRSQCQWTRWKVSIAVS